MSTSARVTFDGPHEAVVRGAGRSKSGALNGSCSRMGPVWKLCLLGGIATALTATTGCVWRHQEPPTPKPHTKPSHFATIDWDAQNDQDPGVPWLSRGHRAPEHELSKLSFWSVYANKQINGLDYRGFIVYRVAGDPEHPTEKQLESAKLDPKMHIVSVFVRRFEAPDPYIDIHLFCQEPCDLLFLNFDNGALFNVRTGETLEAPYWFAPDTYHLTASMSAVDS